MLAPPLKAPDRLETVLESLDDHVAELILTWQELYPELLDVWYGQLIDYDLFLALVWVVIQFLFFFVSLCLLRHNLDMSEQIEVLVS